MGQSPQFVRGFNFPLRNPKISFPRSQFLIGPYLGDKLTHFSTNHLSYPVSTMRAACPIHLILIFITVNIKCGRFSPVYAVKACRGGGRKVQVHSILHSATSPPRPFYHPGKNPATHLNRRLDGPEAGWTFWTRQKSLPLPGFDILTVPHVV